MRRPAESARTAAPTPLEPDLVRASGVYRAVIILLGVWTVFAGLALATQGVPALSLGGDNAAERILGAYMLMLVPVYALIIWRPDENRYLRWIPYAAQIAIILPFFWDSLVTGDHDFVDGALLFVVSGVFLGVLVYLRSSAHPLGFFAIEPPADEFEAEDEGDDEDLPDDEDEPSPGRDRAARGRRYRRST
jgi:hypothetical protein